LAKSLFKLSLEYEPYNGVILNVLAKIHLYEGKQDEALLQLELASVSYFHNRTQAFKCFQDMIFSKAEHNLRFNPIPDIYGFVRFRSIPIGQRVELFMYAAQYWLARRNLKEARYPMEELKVLEGIDGSWTLDKVRFIIVVFLTVRPLFMLIFPNFVSFLNSSVCFPRNACVILLTVFGR
jgi:hypothetical protein